MKDHLFYAIKIHLSLAIFLSFVGCGKHEQSLERIRAERQTTKVAGGGAIEVVESGDLGRLKNFIKEGLDINAQTPEGVTLLMLGVKNKQFAIIEYLINEGADVARGVKEGEEKGKTVHDYIGGDEDVKNILTNLVNKEELQAEWLNKPVFESLKLQNPYNVQWLFEKGAEVNFIWRSKRLTPLIGLFTLIKGVKEDKPFQKVLEMFNTIASQEGVDVNIKFGSKSALKRCKSRARRGHPGYKDLVKRLKDMGAR